MAHEKVVITGRTSIKEIFEKIAESSKTRYMLSERLLEMRLKKLNQPSYEWEFKRTDPKG